MKAPETSDEDLLRAHVDGDPDAFAEIVHRHRDRLWAVALRTLADREEAADALQDALLSAHRAAARFRGEAAVTTWLHRIVINACLDRLRRQRAQRTVPLDGNRPGGGESGESGRFREPAAPIVDHDTALVVREALAKLPMEQRAALVLVDLQGYSVTEVAAILEVAEGTVKSRCARGRAKLAGMLGHLRPTADGGPASARGTAARGTAASESALAGNPAMDLAVPSAMAVDGTSVDYPADGSAGPLDVRSSQARTNAEEQ